MGNILGEPFPTYVSNQIIQRQKSLGKSTFNTQDQIVLNSQNAWVKIASSVVLTKKRYKQVTGTSISSTNDGGRLAKKYVLNGGVGRDGDRAGLKKIDENPAYGFGGFDFGPSPMPGIVSMDLTNINRGSLKKIKIKIKAHNKEQFTAIDILYLRLGYNILIEWGNDKFIDNNGQLDTMGSTLIDRKFFSSTFENSSYQKINPLIEDKRKRNDGNYDGIFGAISNFSWTFAPDGTYDINLEVISLGDVVESLRANLPPLGDFQDPYESLTESRINQNYAGSVASMEQFYDDLYPKLADDLKIWFDQVIKLDGNNPVEVSNQTNFSFTLDNTDNIGFVHQWLEQKGDYFNAWDYDQHDYWLMEYNLVSNANATGFTVGSTTLDADNRTRKIELFSKVMNTVKPDMKRKFNSYTETGISAAKKESFWKSKNVHYTSYMNGYDTNYADVGGENRWDKLEKGTGLIQYEAFMFGAYNPIGNSSHNPWQIQDPNKALSNGTSGRTFGNVWGEESPGYDLLSSHYPKRGAEDFTHTYSNPLYNTDLPSGYEIYKYAGDEWLYTKVLMTGANLDRNDYYRIPNVLGRTFENFKKAFYDAAVRLDTAGGPNDPRFEDQQPDPNTTEDAQVQYDYEASISDFNKNRVIKWLYDAQDFWKENKTQGVAYNTTSNGEVINRFVHRINPWKNGGEKVWNKEMIFPTYKTSTLSPDSLQVTPDYLNPKKKNYPRIPIVLTDFAKVDHKDLPYQYYVRLGCLLQFIQEFIIPKIKGTQTPLFTIDTDYLRNICFVMDQAISTDPRVLLVKNMDFYNGQSKDQLYNGLADYIKKDPSSKYIYGRIMQTYFSFDYVTKLFDSTDESNNISVFKVIKSLCQQLNLYLGSVNNIEPVIDRNNVLRLIDQTQIPGIKKISEELEIDIKTDNQPTLQVFGFEGDKSNFVRKIGITTEVNKNYASMITIGATSQGSVPGMEAIAFSKWNIGVIDRFKNNLIDGAAEANDNLQDQNKNTISNYQTFANSQLMKLGMLNSFVLDSNFITLNQQTVKNFYIYAQSKAAEKDPDGFTASSVGFLPFNLKVSVNGIGGIRIYNKLKVNTKFLPSNYGETLDFLITGVNHKIQNNEWITDLTTIATSANKKTDPHSIVTKDLLGNFGGSGLSPQDPSFVFDSNPDAYTTLGTAGNIPISNSLALQKTDWDTKNAAWALRIDGQANWKASNNALPNLRKRILQVASSYIGQRSNPDEGYPAQSFLDPTFEKIMRKNSNWTSGAHWCNQFCNLVWGEAFVTGNKIVPAATSWPDNYSRVTPDTKYFGFRPKKLNTKTYGTSTNNGFYHDQGSSHQKYGLNTPNCGYTSLGFSRAGYYYNVNGDLDRLFDGIANGWIQPGDLIIYEYSKTFNYYQSEDHIGIFTGDYSKTGKTIGTIEGNLGQAKNYAQLKTRNEGSLKQIDGVARLFTNSLLDVSLITPTDAFRHDYKRSKDVSSTEDIDESAAFVDRTSSFDAPIT